MQAEGAGGWSDPRAVPLLRPTNALTRYTHIQASPSVGNTGLAALVLTTLSRWNNGSIYVVPMQRTDEEDRAWLVAVTAASSSASHGEVPT